MWDDISLFQFGFLIAYEVEQVFIYWPSGFHIHQWHLHIFWSFYNGVVCLSVDFLHSFIFPRNLINSNSVYIYLWVCMWVCIFWKSQNVWTGNKILKGKKKTFFHLKEKSLFLRQLKKKNRQGWSQITLKMERAEKFKRWKCKLLGNQTRGARESKT